MTRRWKDELGEGRVFELRSASKHYPAPCALVVNAKLSGWQEGMFVPVDRYGVIGGHYQRRHNPNIDIAGLRPDQFTSARVRRRRRDLERFDADDLALIRYGYALSFTGEIDQSYRAYPSIPIVTPADWTVFWIPAFEPDDYRQLWHYGDELSRLLAGAWHFSAHGGSRHLGYKFGRVWATRHTGKRLKQIREHFRYRVAGIIEQSVKIVRWSDGKKLYTEEIRRDCPALGSRTCTAQSLEGAPAHTAWRITAW